MYNGFYLHSFKFIIIAIFKESVESMTLEVICNMNGSESA